MRSCIFIALMHAFNALVSLTHFASYANAFQYFVALNGNTSTKWGHVARIWSIFRISIIEERTKL